MKTLFLWFALLGVALRADPTTVVSDQFSNGGNWVFSGGNAFSYGDGLQIQTINPDTIWLNRKLTAPCTISFDAFVYPASGGNNANVADVDFYFMVQGAAAPTTVTYASMLTLNGYQVGFGSNLNTTTRLRKLPGDGTAPTPLLDHRERAFLLKPKVTYHLVVAIAADGTIDVTSNGASFFHYVDPTPLLSGWFGFWTINSHLAFHNFLVTTP
jgi:rhamnogalacturonan endolyase